MAFFLTGLESLYDAILYFEAIMQTIRYVDLNPRRRVLVQNLLATVRQNALSVQDNGTWVQLANTRAPHVMLAIHADENHAKAVADVQGLVQKLDALSANKTSQSLDQLLDSVNFLLDAHPRHHIQL